MIRAISAPARRNKTVVDNFYPALLPQQFLRAQPLPAATGKKNNRPGRSGYKAQ